MAVVRNFEVILGHAEVLSVEMCDFMQCHVAYLWAIYVVTVTFDVSVVYWYDDTILKPKFHFIVFFIKGVLNTRDTNTAV
jgi:hypothetical protein